jgi:hypothetical protein
MRSCETHGTAALAALALMLAGSSLSAQVGSTPGDPSHQCRLARQILTSGHPANKRSWAMSYIGACGAEGGAVLAREVDNLRTAATRTPEMEQLVATGRELQDRSVYEAALRVATNPRAEAVGRVQAMRVLLGQVVTTLQSYEATVADSALVGDGLTEGPLVGTPLPIGYEGETARALAAVADASPPGPVRNAALNVARQARSADRLHRLCPQGTAPEDCIARLHADANP